MKKYRFITVFHNLRLESIKNKGIELYPGARISNGQKIFRETLETELLRYTAGFHSINEFEDATYLYIDGEVEPPILEEDEMNRYYINLDFSLLRQAQLFTHYLWQIKDNNIYVREGFLIIYEQGIDIDGVTHKASLSEVFSYSNSEEEDSIYSDTEIQKAISYFPLITLEDYELRHSGGKNPDSDHFYKKKNVDRMNRAIYFILGARRSATIPMKILSYCTALECLFTTGTSELSYKIAERVALFFGTSNVTKKYYFKVIKDAYNCRSKVVHGQQIGKESDVSLGKLCQDLDEILRQLVVNNHEIFSKSDKEIDDFFLDLVLN